MRTIHKYIIRPNSNSISLPENAEVLCIKLQNNQPFIWVLLNDSEPVIERFFGLFVTGENIRGNFKIKDYIGTVLMQQDSFVFHLFELYEHQDT